MAKRKQKKPARPGNLLPKILIFCGIVLVLFGLITHSRIYSNYIFSQKEVPKAEISSNIPHSLSIPVLNMDIPVMQGGIREGEWVLSDTAALYLPTSGLLDEGYNTVLYAHNTSALFGKLPAIRIGDVIMVRNARGTEYTYQVYERESIDPKDLQKLYSTKKNILTLFTCDGWADQTRLIVRAELISAR